MNQPIGRPVLLGAYAAKTCARAIHNSWDPTITEPDWQPSDGLR